MSVYIRVQDTKGMHKALWAWKHYLCKQSEGLGGHCCGEGEWRLLSITTCVSLWFICWCILCLVSCCIWLLIVCCCWYLCLFIHPWFFNHNWSLYWFIYVYLSGPFTSLSQTLQLSLIKALATHLFSRGFTTSAGTHVWGLGSLINRVVHAFAHHCSREDVITWSTLIILFN